MSQVNIHYAKTHLSKLVERAACGEEIIIARAGKPVARLAPIGPAKHKRRFGAMKGQATVDDRFFEPLPENELAAWE
jgi:prevent-host-death family protein